MFSGSEHSTDLIGEGSRRNFKGTVSRLCARASVICFFFKRQQNCHIDLTRFLSGPHRRRSRLQNSPYFCVFKYVRAVKQKVWNEAENRERDWGETLKYGLSVLHTLYSFELPASPSHGQFPLAKFPCKLSPSCQVSLSSLLYYCLGIYVQNQSSPSCLFAKASYQNYF